MHVLEFFDLLPGRKHVEIIKAFLPEVVRLGGKQFCLPARAWTRPQPLGDALLKDLHDLRGVSEFGLGDQQMDVLGHHHVADDLKAELGAHLFEDAEKTVAPARGTEAGLASMATGGDEVEMLLAVIALESGRHG